jgi:deoxyribonuclease-4
MPFGAHMPITGGISHAFQFGECVGCDAMQIFSKNQRQWQTKPLLPEEVHAYTDEQQRTNIAPVIVHASYLINLAAPADELWHKSIAALIDELERCAMVGIPYLVFHPGSHTGSGDEPGLARIINALNRILGTDAGNGVTILLETTAGQGTALGWRFEQLATLMEHVTHPKRLGVCIDTCHIFAAGYDIRTEETYHATFEAFDRLIGCEHIKLFHLNDSQKDLGSRVDRHQHIGKGYLGVEPFRLLVNDSRFLSLPMIIETPKGKDLAEDKENLALLRSMRSITC